MSLLDRAQFAALCLLLAAWSGGCITNTRYGCETIELLGKGHSEGAVIKKHGAPDNIVYLGTPHYDPNTGDQSEVDKYLFEYRIGGGSTILGPFWADDSFHNICYLISEGKVEASGYVPEGSGSIRLGMGGVYDTPFGRIDMRFGGFLHPKARAGYGGDGSPDSAY